MLPTIQVMAPRPGVVFVDADDVAGEGVRLRRRP
jgi:hypothetical protein